MTIPLRLAPTGYPPASMAAFATPTCRVHPVVRLALFLYVLSIPFEFPRRSIPLEIPTLTGMIFLLTTLLHPGIAFRRVPGAVFWFGLHLWILAAVAIYMQVDQRALATRQYVLLVQLVLLMWTMYNLMADPRVVRGVLVAIVIACTVRAGLQVAGVGTSSYTVWTGGERVTAFGQNANLSAMILSAGLITVLGLTAVRERWLPRLGLLALPLAAVMGWAIVQTGSRGGVLCAAFGLAVFAFAGRTPRQRIRNGIIGLLALGLLIWGVTRSEVLRERFVAAAEQGALAGRENIWPAALEMIQERPLFGWGLIDNQYEMGHRIAYRLPHRDMHNLFLELFTNSGAVGAIPFLVGIVLCLIAAWRARRGPLGVMPLAMVGAILIGTMSGTWIASKILWLCLTVALAAGTHWSSRPPPAAGEFG
jgi:O-antigen ligase